MEWTTTVDAPGKTYLMQGNEAVVRGAVEAGIHFAASYPGSPSSQILGMLGHIAPKLDFYAEWSSNEVCALEACMGASFAGARALCIMKQNGLLCVGDALCSCALSGLRGGLVLISSDDPCSHSSTNEFDSRNMAPYASIPMLEPTTLQETKDMIPYAFELSEKLGQVVLVRLTTRVCHGRGNVTLGELPRARKPLQAIGEWDRMVCINWLHEPMLEKLDAARALFEESRWNHDEGPAAAEDLIIAGGTGRLYCKEALEALGLSGRVGLLSLVTLWPLPEQRILARLKAARRVLIVEEVDPFLERNIAAIAGLNQLQLQICGRLDGALPRISELDPDMVRAAIARFLDRPLPERTEPLDLDLPERELTFCAGCPHRATFFLLKKALRMGEKQGVVVGDIGCYFMAGQRAGQFAFQAGSCMGSGINLAEGLGQLTDYGLDQPVVTMAGDSTFFHSSLPGLVNARYHNTNMLFLVLDNSATAMTGFQPHPGTGQTAMGRPAEPISIEAVARAIGCDVTVADPFEVEETTKTVHTLLKKPGLKVLILRQPCATLASKTRAKRKVWVDPEACRGDGCGCNRFCSRVWGCPGNSWDFRNGHAVIDPVSCVGCGVCAQLCPAGAIHVEGGDGE